MFKERTDECYRHLGLRMNPFTSTPDTRFFYASDQHARALKHMRFGATNASISIITGAIGTGKTLLCRTFLKNMQNNEATAYIFNPLQSELGFLQNIYHDLGGKETGQQSLGDWYKSINRVVIAHAKQGRRSVILVDEAHHMSIRALEILRLLTNLETERRKLLTIILVGQKELEKKLETDTLLALGQRVSVHLILKPLTHQETIKYVNHRLIIAGAQSTLFTPTALKLLAYLSKGIPRVINKVSERALLAVYIKDEFRASTRDILSSYNETRHAR